MRTVKYCCKENCHIICTVCVCATSKIRPKQCAMMTNHTSGKVVKNRTPGAWVITKYVSNARRSDPHNINNIYLRAVKISSLYHTSLPISNVSLVITIKLKLQLSHGLLLGLHSRQVNKVIYFAKTHYHSSFQYPKAGVLLQKLALRPCYYYWL